MSMRKNFKLLVLSFLLVFTGMFGFFTTSEAAVADYVSVTKVVNPTTITVEEEAEVSLNIKGTPPSNVINLEVCKQITELMQQKMQPKGS